LLSAVSVIGNHCNSHRAGVT